MQAASFPVSPVASAPSWLGAREGSEPAIWKFETQALCFV